MDIDLEHRVALRTFPRSIEGERYNRVRLALLRLEDPLRVELPRFGLNLVLQRKAWVGLCMISELPVLAWTAFSTRRRALHEPVPASAGLLMSTVLAAMDDLLKARLHVQAGRPQPA